MSSKVSETAGLGSMGSGSKQLVYSSSREVKSTLEALVRKTLEVKTRIDAFYDVTDNSSMETLNSLVRGDLEEIRSLIGELKHLSVNQRDPEARSMLRRDVETHRSQLESLLLTFKKANLSCIKELERLKRDDLFSASPLPLGNSTVRQRSKKETLDILKETSGVTNRLNSIARQLASTVERSSLTLDDLQESSQTVREINDEYKGIGATLGLSRKLITKYGRREVTDRVLIFLAVAFFFAIVFYIVRKRMFF
ncbi:vesicle transport protein SEC20 [Lepeophtheirus salmonis]|uniref:Vesicle transport protein SEC20 n=2 Tax=Lepeophtheirus salmonis TaxID=72036 RepID=C1BTA4_LEPSM|nr:vesicle transport protein SEC20-like [Lepeophtheirus salmonis]ACO12257.1 Vesicle transport protein SEC20 [Lepeophtheirus salmonis]ADD38371.1 Vesicle transport protein SEC20 [Lepeophtheirus salmonis]